MAKKRTRTRTGVENGFIVADAKRVLKAAKKHWKAMVKLGFAEDDRKRLEELIANVQALLKNTQISVSLDKARKELHDALRSFRTSGSFVAERPGHRDPNARRLLKPFGEFPTRDGLLRTYVTGLPEAIHEYSAQLVQRGFSRAQQDDLEAQIAGFLQALNTRGTLLGEAQAARSATDAAIGDLREEVRYFRRGGHGALYGLRASADFDRLQPAKLAAKKRVRTAKGAAKKDAASKDAKSAGGKDQKAASKEQKEAAV